jgi:RNA polymerase sigma-70 factor (ECF subfamily)
VSASTPSSSQGPAIEPAFTAVYREHHAFVWRSLRRLGVEEADLDDLVQEVFLVAHRRLADFEGRSKLSTWLFGIAYRVVSDHRRKREAGQRREAAVTPPPAPTQPDRKLSRREAAAVLDGLLGRLDPDKRDVFVMAEVAKLTMPEIAEALGININTAYARLRAARARFEAALAEYLEGCSGGVPWIR